MNPLIYVFDIEAENYNRTKRRFYYHLNKYRDLYSTLTRSVIVVDRKHEKLFDDLFNSFPEAKVYKVWPAKIAGFRT